MATRRVPRVGDLYWLPDCPPLQGDQAKTRPVILLTPVSDEAALDDLIVIACTTSARASDVDAIELPSHPSGKSRTGLTRKTWAVPTWYMFVKPSALGRYSGYISGKLLDQVLAAFRAKYTPDSQ